MCVFSQIKEIQHIICRLGHAPGVGHGVLGGKQVKLIFPNMVIEGVGEENRLRVKCSP